MNATCEQCGNNDYEDVGPDNDGYSACCNEPIVYAVTA